jgi:hypothetical protein
VSPRERLIVMVILSAIVLGGAGFLFYSLVLAPVQQADAEIALVKEQNDKKATRIREIEAERPQLERWRQLSLPRDVDLARREYEKHLNDLFRQNGASNNLVVIPRDVETRSTSSVSGKTTIYSKLSFTVTARATLSSYIKILEKFYRTGLLQQIKTVSIQKPSGSEKQVKPGELDMTMTIEALCLSSAEKRATLLPLVDGRLLALDVLSSLGGGPAGLAGLGFVVGPCGPGGPQKLAGNQRKYAAIAGKNVFLGNAAGMINADVAEVTFLTDITTSDSVREATLQNTQTNAKTRLALDSKSASFRIMNGTEVRLEGKTVSIGDREVYFRSGERCYAIRLGSNLAEALKKPLTTEEVMALERPKGPDRPGL